MMRYVLGCVLVTGLGLTVTAERASAQVNFPNQPNFNLAPPVAPILNLARPGGAGNNYYNLVKPQIATNQQLQNLQNQQNQAMIPQLGVAGEDDGYPVAYAITGHPSAFFNYSHYYGQAGGLVRPAQPPLGVYRRN